MGARAAAQGGDVLSPPRAAARIGGCASGRSCSSHQPASGRASLYAAPLAVPSCRSWRRLLLPYNRCGQGGVGRQGWTGGGGAGAWNWRCAAQVGGQVAVEEEAARPQEPGGAARGQASAPAEGRATRARQRRQPRNFAVRGPAGRHRHFRHRPLHRHPRRGGHPGSRPITCTSWMPRRSLPCRWLG